MNHFLLGFTDELEKVAISKKKLLLAALGLGAGGYLYKNRGSDKKMPWKKRKKRSIAATARGGGKSSPSGLFHPGHVRGYFTFPKQRGN